MMPQLKIKNTIIKTVIFDFDGTLAKLNIDFNHMKEGIRKIISSYGIHQDNFHTKYVLEMINAAADILKESSFLKTRKFRAEAMSFIEFMEIQAARQGELFNRTRELLLSLKSKGIATGVISRNCKSAVYTVFRDISSYCDTVVCRDNIKNVKPHPEHLNKALHILKKRSSNTLMIGDHPLDIETGKLAGTFTAGVLTGHFQETDFFQAGADLVLPTASDLIKMIE